MSDTTIDEILNDIVWKLTNQNIVKYEMVKATSLTKQAKSALYDLMLEVIGVDDRIIELSGNSRFDQQVTSQVNGANDLRAEQRNKLKELFDDNLQ